MSQDAEPRKGAAFGGILLVCAAIGFATIVGSFAWGRRVSLTDRVPARDRTAATEEYGKRLIAQTTEILGPDVADPKMRYTNSRLACAACHTGAGLEPGNLSLATAVTRYPRISPRSAAKETIEDRINGCMMRSMNGRPLPDDSPEMIAMVAYLDFLARQDEASGASRRETHDPPSFKTPDRAADLDSGKDVFTKRCAACHGQDGAGVPAAPALVHGYVFPPLWGPDSFNDGAGLHRVLTAARFIKAKMPLGKPDLDDQDAFDVAAFINSKPRPGMAGLDRDYPDRTKKPVDTAYLPYADPFPPAQHRFGPFPPIEAYYSKLHKPSK